MTKRRTGRQKYYNFFSHFYDHFIKMHSSNDRDETRQFLVASANLEGKKHPRVLDICCGTGSVILAFSEHVHGIFAVGVDFSIGMLNRARAKDASSKAAFVKGDAADLPFVNDYFDIVCCSHALYELKGHDRNRALSEMRRVIKPDGKVLIMEHEVPRKRWVKVLFSIRMLMMGPKDAQEFVNQGISPFQRLFSQVALTHTPSGKSKLIICRKRDRQGTR
ncbi:UbiE2 [Desulfosarcina cetonica]|nr:UbiE2 [Desulfosarcina cetonica]